MNGPSLAKTRTEKFQIRLYNLAEDPNETKNVSQSHPELVGELMEKLAQFRKLQPADAVPPYIKGRKGFQAPEDWKISE